MMSGQTHEQNRSFNDDREQIAKAHHPKVFGIEIHNDDSILNERFQHPRTTISTSSMSDDSLLKQRLQHSQKEGDFGQHMEHGDEKINRPRGGIIHQEARPKYENNQ